MENTNNMKKILIGLTCLAILVLVGFSIYQHQQLKSISGIADTGQAAVVGSSGDTLSDQVDITRQDPDEKAPSPSAPTTQHYSGDIAALEEQLDATEAELDAMHMQLADEAARKEELKQKELELQQQYTNDPSYKSYMRNALSNQYKDILDEMDLSPETREQFIDILLDQNTALSEVYPEMSSATTKEQKTDLQKRLAEIREEYETKIKDLLGTDYDTYYDYTEMATTRSVINGFKASLSTEDQLTEEQEQKLTKIMYKEQMDVFSEIGYDPRKEIEFESDVKSGEVDGELKNMEKIHTRSVANSKGVLSASQLEKYEEYLKSQRDMREMYSTLSE